MVKPKLNVKPECVMAKPNFMVKLKPKVGISDLNNGNDNAAYVM
jgi:hypothetical protein